MKQSASVFDQLTSEERAHLARSMEGHPDPQAWLDRVEAAYQRVEPVHTNERDLTTLKAAVLNQIHQPAVGKTVPGPRLAKAIRSGGFPAKAGSHRLWGRIAVAGAGLGLAGILFATAGGLDLVGHGFSGGSATTDYHTGIGEQRRLTLADGSEIILAPASILTVPKEFGTTARALALEGEAYFDVASDGAHPFIVRTGSVTTTVLGTAFLVKRYAGDSAASVAVASGKVVTAGRGGSITLSAGMAGFVSDSSSARRSVSDLAEYDGWTNGQLVFKSKPVTEVLATLSRWYGYTFVLGDSTLRSLRVTTELELNNTNETLGALRRLLGVRFEMRDSTVILIPDSARVGAPAMPSRDGRVPGTYTTTEVGR